MSGLKRDLGNLICNELNVLHREDLEILVAIDRAYTERYAKKRPNFFCDWCKIPIFEWPDDAIHCPKCYNGIACNRSFCHPPTAVEKIPHRCSFSDDNEGSDH